MYLNQLKKCGVKLKMDFVNDGSSQTVFVLLMGSTCWFRPLPVQEVHSSITKKLSQWCCWPLLIIGIAVHLWILVHTGQMETAIHDGVLRPLRREGHRPREKAIEVREKFKSYFVSPAGAVSWQIDACFRHAN